jgi:hypothetical protein
MSRQEERPVVRESRGLRRNAQAYDTGRDRRWLWLAGALGALALIVAAVFLSRGGSGADLSQVVEYPDLERGHQSGTLTYEQTPPVGGIHNGAWQNCGIYDAPVGNEYAVHSLEHGAVWITYDAAAITGQDLETLRNHARARPFTLLSPYEGLPSPIVLSAWGVQLLVEEPNDPRISAFIAQYRQGPQTPEPGATCSGAIGEPIET